MEHNEFVEKSRGSEMVWGVEGFYRPVHLVWGFSRLLSVLAVSLLILTPTLGFGFYCA